MLAAVPVAAAVVAIVLAFDATGPRASDMTATASSIASAVILRASGDTRDIPRPSASPREVPAVVTELVPFTSAEGGYEILLPRLWGDGQANRRFPDIREFAGLAASARLSISVGTRDGALPVCQNTKPCRTIVATSLDELESKLTSVPDEFVGALRAEQSGAITLGGQPGRFKRPGLRHDLGDGDWGIRGQPTGNCLGCPGVRYFAFTIKDGRPVVISIDWWTIMFDRLPRQSIAAILASFHFIG